MRIGILREGALRRRAWGVGSEVWPGVLAVQQGESLGQLGRCAGVSAIRDCPRKEGSRRGVIAVGKCLQSGT